MACFMALKYEEHISGWVRILTAQDQEHYVQVYHGEKVIDQASGFIHLDIGANKNYLMRAFWGHAQLQFNQLKSGDNGYLSIEHGANQITAFFAPGFHVVNKVGELKNREMLVYICSGDKLVISRFCEGDA